MLIDNTEDHEMQILGAIKGKPGIISEYSLTDDLFFNPINKKIFKVMKEIYDDGIELDYIVFYDRIINTDLEKYISYYSKLEIFWSFNAEYYIKRQQEKIKLKNIELLNLYINDWLKSEKSAEDILAAIDEKITNLNTTEDSYTHRLGEFLPQVLDEIEQAYKSKGKIKGIESGFHRLDLLLNGFNKKNIIVIGARPSQGKTSLAMNMAVNIARNNIHTGFISIEMDGLTLSSRAVSSKANLNSYSVSQGRLKASDFGNLTEASNILDQIPLFIHDRSSIKLSQVKALIRLWKRKGIKIIFIDYFTYIKHDNQNIPRREQYGDISKSLKSIAKETDLPIIVLSQLNRDGEGKPPTMANLKETSELEDDADIIMFLHRKENETKTQLIIVKNRNGAKDIIDLDFKKETTTFYEMEQNYDE